MQVNWPWSNAAVLKTEGGYVNNPKDPGGPTYKGITLATGRKMIDPKLTSQSLQKLSDTQIGIVYKANYWDKINGDAQPGGLDYTLHDYGVNSGVGRPNNVLRALLELPKNASTFAVAHALQDYDTAVVINAVNDERMAFLHGLGTFATFGRGWTSRVAGVRSNSLRLAATGGPTDIVPEIGTAKAVKPDKIGAGSKATAATGIAAAPVAATPGFHLGGYGALALALGAVALIALVIYLINRANETAANAPTPGLIPLAKRGAKTQGAT